MNQSGILWANWTLWKCSCYYGANSCNRSRLVSYIRTPWTHDSSSQIRARCNTQENRIYRNRYVCLNFVKKLYSGTIIGIKSHIGFIPIFYFVISILISSYCLVLTSSSLAILPIVPEKSHSLLGRFPILWNHIRSNLDMYTVIELRLE